MRPRRSGDGKLSPGRQGLGLRGSLGDVPGGAPDRSGVNSLEQAAEPAGPCAAALLASQGSWSGDAGWAILRVNRTLSVFRAGAASKPASVHACV